MEPNPPRLALGSYGLAHDLAREADVLAAQGRVQAALAAEVRAAGPTIFTDAPGVAAASGVQARIQVFEQRQLFDQGLAAQNALLLELANGELPLAVVDYLGNWLTPQMVAIIERRYAHDGSLGTFDLYRPVALGPSSARSDVPLSGLRLSGLRLEPLDGPSAAYEPGAIVALALEWQRDGPLPPADLRVKLRLRAADGSEVLTSERPLLYGAFPPAAWPEATVVQHLQPLRLPAPLAAARYSLSLELHGPDGGSAPIALGQLAVAPAGGQHFAATDYFVPGEFMRAWNALGGMERIGQPLTPALRFAWGRLQCFEYSCLELRAGQASLRPLGERLYLAETLHATDCNGPKPPASRPAWLRGPLREFAALVGLLADPALPPAASSPPTFCPSFAEHLVRYGTASLGEPLSGQLERNGHDIQWTRLARLERQLGTGAIGLGRLGDDSLRLPPGVRYRWPWGSEKSDE